MDIRIVELFADIAYAFQARMRSPEHLDGTGLSPFQVRTLAFFARWPGARASQLAARSGRDKAQIARMIRELENRGLVERGHGGTDRRVARIDLTTKGRQLYEQLNEKRVQVVEMMLENLGSNEREQLLSLLLRMRNSLGDAGTPRDDEN